MGDRPLKDITGICVGDGLSAYGSLSLVWLQGQCQGKVKLLQGPLGVHSGGQSSWLEPKFSGFLPLQNGDVMFSPIVCRPVIPAFGTLKQKDQTAS